MIRTNHLLRYVAGKSGWFVLISKGKFILTLFCKVCQHSPTTAYEFFQSSSTYRKAWTHRLTDGLWTPSPPEAGVARSHRTKARNWTSSNSNLLTSRFRMLSYWMLLFMNSPWNLLADHCIWRIFLYVDYWEVETISCSKMRPGSQKLLGCLLPPLITPQTKSPPQMHREVLPSIHRLTDAPLPTHIFCVIYLIFFPALLTSNCQNFKVFKVHTQYTSSVLTRWGVSSFHTYHLKCLSLWELKNIEILLLQDLCQSYYLTHEKYLWNFASLS